MNNDDLSEDFKVDVDIEYQLEGKNTKQLLLILISMCKNNKEHINKKLDKLEKKSIEDKLEKINTRLDELGFDIIRVGDEIDNMSKKIDAISSINSDPAELNGKKKNCKQTRSIVTAFWKRLYADNMTFSYKGDIVNSDITGVLQEIGITAELINYVRQHKSKDNSHSVKREYQEHEGWFVWKELQNRIKKQDNTKSEVAMIKKRIQSLHTKFKNDRTKANAIENKMESISEAEDENSNDEIKSSIEVQSSSKSVKKKNVSVIAKKTTKSNIKQNDSKIKKQLINHPSWIDNNDNSDNENNKQHKSYYIDTDEF